MSKVFISGPITGVENYRKAFAERENALKEMGYIVVNAVKVGDGLAQRLHREPHYEEYMKETLSQLLECDCVSMLDGWEESKGASFEHQTAEIAGIPFVDIKMFSRKW